MLNKLLKRCTPWMDKGRWISIRVVGSNPANSRTVFNSDEILSAVIQPGNQGYVMTVTTKHIPHIIDCKFCPEDNFGLIIVPSMTLTTAGDQIFEVPMQGPGTYWFFMR